MQDEEAGVAGARLELADQAGLADSRLAGDQREPGAPAAASSSAPASACSGPSRPTIARLDTWRCAPNAR